MAPLAKGGVVDNNFKVYGTQNLRVVDSSIFPNIPGYYPMVPILMISEKASDVVLAAAAGLHHRARRTDTCPDVLPVTDKEFGC